MDAPGPSPVVETLTLDAVVLGVVHRVAAVVAPPAAPHWERWLQEIGFISGEPVSVLRRGMPGGEPLMVRVGDSIFALRRAEAACIRVRSS